MKQILFLKDQHDTFIDFIKAYAILGVLFVHTWIFAGKIPGLGLFFGVDVPLFLLIQTFHFYKKDSVLNFKKIFNRIFLPFILIQTVLFAFVICSDLGNCKRLLGGVISFGYGPGSYYPLIYIQIALLLYCFKDIFRHLSKSQLFVTFLLIAECLELLCSFVHVPEWLYRVLAIRYVFLIYLGFIWVKEGIAINVKNVMLCVISAIAAVFFVYSSNEHEPWFFNTAWSYSRWPCYFWVSNGLVMLLWYLWEFLKKSQMVVSAVNVLAKTTWEIYLMQMASIYILNKDMISVDNKVLHYFLYASIICTISIGGGILLNKLFTKFIYNYSHVQKHN